MQILNLLFTMVSTCIRYLSQNANRVNNASNNCDYLASELVVCFEIIKLTLHYYYCY